MFIRTRESWEVKSDYLNGLFGEEDVRRYPFVELGLNLNLFHVDVHHKLDEDGMSYCDRWIFTQLNDLFEAIESTSQAEKITISLQSRRCDNSDNEYSISTIAKIVKGEDRHGQVCYVFKCLNGKSYVQSNFDIQEYQIVNPRVVYSLKC